ncbi:MAG: helix-turn-helix domain-containing protein [Oscillospiraceae bacterium]|jgi:DNA-binding XRE family transcriptional regulator|nr:helix-turn-helix domain-containing protein [Oscillospiraceae bacterium]
MTAMIYIYDKHDDSEEAVCSLQPEPNGDDDGGRDYVLPKNYEWKADGIYRSEHLCELGMHNGAPLLIDTEKKLAFLLEQEKKMEQMRTLADMTRQQLADAVGLTQYDIYQFENHEVEPGSAILGKIAEVLGCETVDLI